MSVLAFDTPGGPVTCRGVTPDLRDYFDAQAPRWPVVDARSGAEEITVQTDAGGWRFRSSAYEAPDFRFDDGLGAGNGLIGCLIHTFIAASEDWIAFHAGAVATDDGLTVLTGDMMAGKSTLTAAMAALGHQVWCDDRLPVVQTGAGFDGMSLALRPKLRDPLPGSAPAAFRRFVEDRQGPAEDGMRYLVLKAAEYAGFNARAQVRRIVVLDRAVEHGTPDAVPLPLGQVVKRIAACTFAPHLGPTGLLQRLRAIAESSECIMLSYSDSFDAAAFAHDNWGVGR